MKNIRNKVFETNSSSTHSVSIVSNISGIYDSIIPDNGVITLIGGEFGWEWEKFNDATTKANYAAVFCQDYPQEVEMLNEVLKEQTGAQEIIWNLGDRSYIDHQSSWSEDGEAKAIFKSKETLKNWIFNPSCWLYTGNDNEPADYNFYDHPESKYTHFLKVEDAPDVTGFLGYPEISEIKKALKLMSYKLLDKYIPNNYRIFDPDTNKIKDLDGKELNSFSLIEDGICILYDAEYVVGNDKITTFKVNSIESIKFTISKIKDETNST